MTGRAVALVSGVIDIDALMPVVASTVSVEPPDVDRRERRTTSHAADVPLIDLGPSAASSLLIVSRAAFDRALAYAAAAAGAHWIRERATAVSADGDAMIVHTTRAAYNVDYVLGADGANSIVRKKLARPFTREQLSVAAGYFVPGMTGSAIYVRTISARAGYLWSFPRHDHAAVGVCAPAALNIPSAELRTHTRDWIEQHAFGISKGMTPYAWPIPSTGWEDASSAQLSGNRWMLLGDGAGLVDPLTREGIYYALLSGRWAAEALMTASPSTAGRLYADRIRSDVHPELARAARLCDLFFSAGFSSLLPDALRHSAAIRTVFADLVSGTQPYRGLRRRLLGTRQWLLAGRAIRLAVMPSFTGTIRRVALSHS